MLSDLLGLSKLELVVETVEEPDRYRHLPTQKSPFIHQQNEIHPANIMSLPNRNGDLAMKHADLPTK
jgi:ribosomal protein L24